MRQKLKWFSPATDLQNNLYIPVYDNQLHSFADWYISHTHPRFHNDAYTTDRYNHCITLTLCSPTSFFPITDWTSFTLPSKCQLLATQFWLCSVSMMEFNVVIFAILYTTILSILVHCVTIFFPRPINLCVYLYYYRYMYAARPAIHFSAKMLTNLFTF